MMMKKWMITLTAAILLLLAVPLCSAQAEELSGANWFYRDTVLTITGNLPNYGLASSKSSWFIGTPFEVNDIDHLVTEIIVEEGVTSIGELAFYGMSKLTKVTFPSTLKSIGSDAFMQCTALTEVTIPASVTFLGHGAFYNCRSLKKIVFEGTPPTIGTWDAYYDFHNQSNFIFSGCTADVYYKPYPSWTDSRIAAYSKNFYPTWHMVFDASGDCGINAKWYLVDGDTLVIRGSGAIDDFSNYATTPWYAHKNSVASLMIASGITRIGECAFDSFDYVSHVSLPSTLKEIGGWAFFGCDKLTAIDLPEGLELLESGAFNSCYNLASIVLPESITEIPQKCFTNCTSLHSVTIPATIKHIGATAFNNTPSLASIAIPQGVETIGKQAFTASGLTEISLPLSIESISSDAFLRCPENLVILCHADSYAAQYAAGQNLTVDLEPHTETVIPAVKPTCTTNGLTAGRVCAICERTLIEQELVLSPGHNYSEPEFLWAEDGSACAVTFTCPNCGDVQNPAVAVTSEVISEPDCLNPGKTKYTATTAFGEEKIPDPENPDGTITQPKVYTDQLVLADTPALGHTQITIPGIEPTCTELGMMDYIFCETCGEEIQLADEIPALGHTETISVEALEPTCTEEGHTQQISCSVCEEVLTPSKPIAALGHTAFVSVEAVAPDCISTGLTEEISCSVCFEVLTPAQKVAPLGHTPEIDAAVAPDCIHTGLAEGSHCSVCGEILIAQETVAALGHTPETDEAVPPTDRESGLTEGSHCFDCGEILVMQEIIPANFAWDGNTVTAYNGAATDVIIPDGVTALGNTVFKNNTAITSVRIPDSVTEVGTQTFFGCTAITDVWLPDHLSSIGAQTFYNVKAKFHVSADGATAIALSYRSLSFTMDSGMTLRYRVTSATGHPTAVWLIAYDGQAESVALPEKINDVPLTEIRTKAFASCAGLKKILIPASVTTIAADSFEGVAETLIIRSAVDAYARTWASNNGFAWEHDQHTELVLAAVAPTCTEPGLTEGRLCSVCDEVLTEQKTIDALGHTEIIDQAVPATHVTTGLTEGSHCETCGKTFIVQEEIPLVDVPVIVLPAMLKAISAEAFSGNSFACVVIPEGCMRLDAAAFKNCEQLRYIEIPATVTQIADSSFTGCSEELIIVTVSGSTAEAFALAHDITCIIH